jgi:hypothetical protein
VSADVIKTDPKRGSSETFLDPFTLHSKYKSKAPAIEKSATSCTVSTNAVWTSMLRENPFYICNEEEEKNELATWRNAMARKKLPRVIHLSHNKSQLSLRPARAECKQQQQVRPFCVG